MPTTSSNPRDKIPRIDADFNRLGQGGPDVLPLGTDKELLERLGWLPNVGERLLAIEEGSLEALGTVRAEEMVGRRYWLLDIEPDTLRQVE